MTEINSVELANSVISLRFDVFATLRGSGASCLAMNSWLTNYCYCEEERRGNRCELNGVSFYSFYINF